MVMTQQPNVYELLGRKEVELAQKHAALDTAFQLIRQLKEGKVSLDDIELESGGAMNVSVPVAAPGSVGTDNGAKPQEAKVRKSA